MQCHIHSRTDRRAVYHGDGRFVNLRDISMELGETVIEGLTSGINSW